MNLIAAMIIAELNLWKLFERNGIYVFARFRLAKRD